MTGRDRAALRSQAWLAGDDEVAVEHRVALASAGLPVSRAADRPVIGIANSASELNPCNLPLRELAGEVRAGIEEAGGIGAEFGTISLGEDLMKPSAMLYRNLLAIEIEEMVRANPLDGLVVLANCDKSVPGALMGAISANVPTVLVTGGARPVAQFRGQPVGTGTALWRMWDERRAGRLDDAGWARVRAVPELRSRRLQHDGHRVDHGGPVGGARPDGARLGVDPGRRASAAARPRGRPAGVAVSAVLADLRPQSILTPDSFANADRRAARDRRLHQRRHPPRRDGGPGRACRSRWRTSAGSARTVPVLADVEPSGSGLMPDFDTAGGVPTLLRELAGQLRTGALTVTGQTHRGRDRRAPRPATGAIRPASDAAARGRRIRRRPGLAGAGRRRHQDLGGDAGAAAAPRARRRLPRLRRHAGPDRRPGAADHAADGAGAGRAAARSASPACRSGA